MRTLKDADLNGKIVLVRVDFNVPMEQGRITADERIRATLPTIKYLLGRNCSLVLMSHLGNPKGKRVPELSLEPIAKHLEGIFHEEGLELKLEVKENVQWVGKKFIFESPRLTRVNLPKVALLENLRFWWEEEACDEGFAKLLANLGQVFVQEAFACCHRQHASIVGIPRYLPSYAGFLVEKEVAFLNRLLTNPPRPFIAIVGGKKIETKTKSIDKISEIADLVIIGGLIEKEIREKGIAQRFPHKIVGPIDEVDGKDICPRTIELFKQKIASAKTVFWSGPMGAFEEEKYSEGTMEIAKTVAQVPLSVVGGGDTANAVKRAGVADKITYISTGGGATLKFIEEGTLPGIVALEENEKWYKFLASSGLSQVNEDKER